MSVPTESVPTESVPTDSVPTESVPTDSVPTDSVPTDSVPTDSVPTDRNPFAVITGASSGIGLELAKIFVARGHDVLVTAEDAELRTVAEGLRGGADPGQDIDLLQADLATREGVEALLAAVAGAARPVDSLVLNAGVGNGGPFIETPLEADLEVIDLNITAVVHLAKRLLPDMVQRGEGRVLITASTASILPGPWYATYAASKAFALHFAEAIRHELKDTGVTVTALLPGPTDTEFFEASNLTETTVGRQPKDDPAKVAAAGFEAMMKGEHKVVVSSVKARSQTAMGAVLPEPAKAAVHGRMTKPDREKG